MNHILHLILLPCLVAGVVSELITIASPARVLDIGQRQPDEILASRFYRIMFLLSGLYLLAVVLMILSQADTFRTYGLILLLLSFAVWGLRRWMLRFRMLQVAESTVCLILLLDAGRKIMRAYLG